MDVFGKIIIVILLAFAVIFLPSSYTAKKQDTIDQILVQNETRKFCDDVRTKGYLTEGMYIAFAGQLDSTGNLYDITLEHSHVVTDPQVDETGAVIGYEEYAISTYSEEIRTAIRDGKKRYRMAKGDYFSVTIKNRSDTLGDAFDRLLYGMKTSDITILATAGGIIRDEEIGEDGT